MLVKLFNEYGFDDRYGQGFPSRHTYAEERLNSLNGKPEMKALIQEVFNPVEFIEEPYSIDESIDKLNKYLVYDGYKLKIENNRCMLLDINGQVVDFKLDDHDVDGINHEYINSQIEKCNNKISSSDYDGAITNARSLTEAVLLHIESKFNENADEYDGDLIKLYRRVQKYLNLTPDSPNLDKTLKQVLVGLTSVVTGLSGMRNKMSDAHATRYKPAKHHALLAINSAKTLCDFLYDTLDYQSETKK